MVAVLDSRLATARYGGFLRASLPPFWPTTDRAMVLAALKRLDETAAEPLPVHEPALRGMGGADAAAADGDARPVASAPPTAASPRTAVTQGHAWTRDEDTELREGVDLGLSLEELADHLEVPEDLVRARLTMLRLEVSAGARCPSTERSAPGEAGAAALSALSEARGRLTPVTTHAPATGIPPLVLITGPEGVLAERAVTSILDALRVGAPDLEVIRLARRLLRGRRARPARQPVAVRRATRRSSCTTSTRPPTSCRPTCSASSRAPAATSPSSSPTRAARAARRSSTR